MLTNMADFIQSKFYLQYQNKIYTCKYMYISFNKSVRPIETKDFCSIKYFYLIIRWV